MTSPPPSDQLAVHPIRSDSDRAGAYEVRRKVFVQEQGVPEELEMDAIDDTAIHLVAALPQRVIGTARLFPGHGRSWHVGRVAVLPEWRGHGIGERLMRLAAEAARELGGETIELHAQLGVVGFYERLGYQAEGDPFEEAGIMHRSMRRRLD